MPQELKSSGSYLPQKTMSTSHTVAPPVVIAGPPLPVGTESCSGTVTWGGTIVTCQARLPLRIDDQNCVRMKMSPYWPLPPGNACAVKRPESLTALVTDELSSWTLLPGNRNRTGT